MNGINRRHERAKAISPTRVMVIGPSTEDGRPDGTWLATDLADTMRIKNLTLLTGLCVLLSVAGCSEPQGEFALRFRWMAPEPEPNTILASVVVGEQRAGPLTSIEPITEPVEALYRPGLSLTLDQVPYGDERIVVVQGLNATSRSLAFIGVSEPFDLREGGTYRPPTTVPIDYAPEIQSSGEGTAGFRVVDAQAGRINRPNVVLAFEARGLRDIRLALTPEFSVGRVVRRPSPSSGPNREGFLSYEESYDLLTDLSCASPGCGDGPKAIYLEGIGLAGERSPTVRATIDLDTISPSVLSSSVRYLAPATNPLARPTRATAGTSIEVDVIASEPLAMTPEPHLVGRAGSSTLAFTLFRDPINPAALRFLTLVPADTPSLDRSYQLELEATDRAQNTDTITLQPVVRIDTSTPALVVDQTALRYVRAPVGSRRAESLGPVTLPAGPRFVLGPSDERQGAPRLAGSTFLFQDGSQPVAIRVWGDADQTIPLGSAVPEADGWPRIYLDPRDFPRVFVSGLDPAGNESAAVPVRRSEYVATTARDPFGQRTFSVGILRDERSRRSQVDASSCPGSATATDCLDEPDGGELEVRSGLRWEALGGGAQPRGVESGGLAYDARRRRTVLFGGVPGQDNTWEWNGYTWTEVFSETTPRLRDGLGMVYDPTLDRVLIFGGLSEAGLEGELWSWDGQSWRNLGPGPAPRSGPAMAYDGLRGEVVVFGGNLEPNPLVRPLLSRETWTWNAQQGWLQSNPSTSPPPRLDARIAYSPARNGVILYGGFNANFQWLHETWFFDGTNWLPLPTNFPPPVGGSVPSLTQDRSGVVLLGTFMSDSPETRAYRMDGGQWRLVARFPKISPRTGQVSAFDEARGQVLIFGGVDLVNSQPLSELWAVDGAEAFSLSPQDLQPRNGLFVGYDRGRDVAVIYGGCFRRTGADCDRPDSELDETLEWSGGVWRRVQTTTRPPPLQRGAMAYDPRLGEMLIFGGCRGQGPSCFPVDETWSWNGVRWMRHNPPVTPGPRSEHSLAEDPLSGQVLLVGGSPSDTRVWAWDGRNRTWAPLFENPQPPFLESVRMTTDPSGSVVLLGLGNRGLETWLRGPQGWAGPTRGLDDYDSLEDFALAFVDLFQRPVLHGGFGRRSGEVSFNDRLETWLVSSLQPWQPIESSIAPDARFRHGMVHSSRRGTTVLFGDNNVQDDRTWLLENPGRPAVDLDITLPTGVSPQDVSGLSVRGRCRGTSGAELTVWQTGVGASGRAGFLSLAESLAESAAGAPSLLEGAVETASTAQSFVTLGSGQLRFRCRPRAMGTANASVHLDHFELRIRY